MDNNRFDAFTKALATGASRRVLLRRLGAGLAGVTLAEGGRGASRAAPNACAGFCDQLFDEGPGQATCKQVCESCPGGVARLCVATTEGVPTGVTCCSSRAVCCAGGACCSHYGACCGSTCCERLGDICCAATNECCESRREVCSPLGCRGLRG